MIYLSIIIPIRNEEKFIGKTLEALINQAYPKERYEIMVVDGRSTDETQAVVNEFIKAHSAANVRLLDNPGILSSRARNIGVREARGQLIGVIDGHVYIPNDLLFANMERLAKENKALCLARPAPLDVPGLNSGKPYWIAVARKSWLGHSRNSYIYSDYEGFVDPRSSAFAYHENVFDKVGYFDESFDAAEDVEFHFRLKKAGIMAYTSPKLLIYSFPRDSFLGLFRQQARYGEGRARLVRKHHDGLTKETPIPAAIFLMFALLPVVAIFLLERPLLALPYWAVIIIYIFVLLAYGLLEALKRNVFFPGLFVALGLWTTHMGLGWGFLKTIFLPQRILNRKSFQGSSITSF